jgi:hypothetical protein
MGSAAGRQLRDMIPDVYAGYADAGLPKPAESGPRRANPASEAEKLT